MIFSKNLIFPGTSDSIGWFNDVYKTTEGNFAIAGRTGIPRYSYFWLTLTTDEGEIIYQNIYPEDMVNPRCEAYTLIQDDGGGFVMGGTIGNENLREFGVIRVSNDGRYLWRETWGRGYCLAVIEMKDNNFLACGCVAFQGQGVEPFLVKFNGDGETIWQQFYIDDGTDMFTSMREIEDGVILTAEGNAIPASVYVVDDNGELVRSFEHGDGVLRSIVSCDGGFLAGGTSGQQHLALRLDRNGDLIWRRTFDGPTTVAVGKMPDGGFALVGGLSNGHQMVRIDQGGNFMWNRRDNINQGQFSPGWQSVVVLDDGAIVVAGNRNSCEGVLMKLQPDVSPPRITSYRPSKLHLFVLQGESIVFEVDAVDIQEDSLWYRLYWNNFEISAENSVAIQFDSLGVDTVTFLVLDSTGFDSITWHVTVTDLYISAFTPDTLDLAIRRGTTVDFSLDTIRFTDGAEPEILWTKTNLANGQADDAGTESRATIDFPWSGEYSVEGKVTRGESSNAVTWHVDVRGAIWAFVPVTDSLEVVPDSVVHFEVVPTLPEDESLEVRWSVDGELVREGELALDWAFSLGEADSCPPYHVQCVVADSVEADTVAWVVTVNDLGIGDIKEVGQAETPILLSVSPNPFIRY